MTSAPESAALSRASNNILDAIVESIVCSDIDGHIIFWNSGAEQLYGYSADEAIGRHVSMLYPRGAEGEAYSRNLAEQLRTGQANEGDVWRCKKSGERVFIHRTSAPLRDKNGRLIGLVAHAIDITRRKLAEDALAERDMQLREQHTLYQAMLDAQSMAGVGLVILDDGRAAFANQAAAQITGYSVDELMALSHFNQVTHPDDRERVQNNYHRRLNGEVFDNRYDISILTKDGRRREVEIAVSTIKGAAGTQILVVLVDITERKNTAQVIQHLALHDALTGLSNRTLLFDRLDSAISAARRRNSSFALFFLDLDNFKPINDELGHDAGDLVLKIIAERLHNSVRESDTVARVGGDEFVLVLQDVHGRKAALAVAEKTIAALSQPISTGSKLCEVGATLGIALYPEHGEDADTLMRHADAAMYAAKRLGKNRCLLWQD
ncbi:MAG: diguanylate cyclase [Betaproteobacteria bacterium]|nr:diguanylate cyclase [Betaproteobacteria bacterium]